MKNVFSNVLECVGGTPIVKLNRLGSNQAHNFYVKLEFLNPGHSIKDRIALQMVNDAEKSGELKPGGTIIECTSGNTGMGLAMVAAVKGYKSIFVMPDKISDEKVKALRALGARVVSTPTAVEPDDPRSYYSVAKRLAAETPNSFYTDQYHSPSNPLAHYNMTGPEIWEQMGGEVDYLISCMGTGGTISGTAKFLKEKNPKIKVIGVDPEGSVFYEYFKTGNVPKLLTTYKVEGFGEDFIPDAADFKIVDDMLQVSDKECFQTGRDLSKKEGIFGGGSCGGAVAAALKYAKNVEGKKNFLILLPDSGSRYLSKMFDDDWMREHGFLESEASLGSVRDVIGERFGQVITAERQEKVKDVISLMREHSVSQLPVVDQNKLIGLITELDLLNVLMEGRGRLEDSIETYVDQDFKVLSPNARASELTAVFRDGQIAIIVDEEKVVGITTKIDLVEFISQRVPE